VGAPLRQLDVEDGLRLTQARVSAAVICPPAGEQQRPGAGGAGSTQRHAEQQLDVRYDAVLPRAKGVPIIKPATASRRACDDQSAPTSLDQVGAPAAACGDQSTCALNSSPRRSIALVLPCQAIQHRSHILRARSMQVHDLRAIDVAVRPRKPAWELRAAAAAPSSTATLGVDWSNRGALEGQQLQLDPREELLHPRSDASVLRFDLRSGRQESIRASE